MGFKKALRKKKGRDPASYMQTMLEGAQNQRMRNAHLRGLVQTKAAGEQLTTDEATEVLKKNYAMLKKYKKRQGKIPKKEVSFIRKKDDE